MNARDIPGFGVDPSEEAAIGRTMNRRGRNEDPPEIELRKRQQHLSAKLRFLEDTPTWFERRLIEETGFTDEDLGHVEATSAPNAVILLAAKLDKLEHFLARWAAGAITEHAGEQVINAESPYLTPEERSELATASPRIPRGPGRPRKPEAPPEGRDPFVPGTTTNPSVPSASSCSTHSEPTNQPKPMNATALLKRFDRLDKPHGFIGKFLKEAGLNSSSMFAMRKGKAGECTLERFAAALDKAERGEIKLGRNGRAHPKARPAQVPPETGTNAMVSSALTVSGQSDPSTTVTLTVPRTVLPIITAGLKALRDQLDAQIAALETT